MIDEFLSSWDLFHNAYLAGFILSVLLSLVGVIVVARDQIFLGAALAEASTLGVAVGLWLTDHELLRLPDWVSEDLIHSLLAVVFSILAAWLTTRTGREGASEAITGWVFLLAGSLSILFVSHSPHGMEEVHRLIASSIIGSSTAEVVLFGAVTAAVFAAMFRHRRRILLILTDVEMAQAVGLRVGTWSFLLSTLLGLTVGLALRASGLLFTFGCLILPTLAARSLARSARPIFWLSPAIGLGVTVASFVLANHYDHPPGQMTAALLCAVTAVCVAGRWVVGRR